MVRGVGAADAPGSGPVPGAPGGALRAAPKLHRRGGKGGEDARLLYGRYVFPLDNRATVLVVRLASRLAASS
jgi:hypothetical protein